MNYLSYLLRLWRVGGGLAPLWRASLQRPGTAETVYFADLAALVGFLRSEIRKTDDDTETESRGDQEEANGEAHME